MTDMTSQVVVIAAQTASVAAMVWMCARHNRRQDRLDREHRAYMDERYAAEPERLMADLFGIDPDCTDDLTRRIADCLERHLPDMGFQPYRYPSGENKSVELLLNNKILVSDTEGRAWLLSVERVAAF